MNKSEYIPRNALHREQTTWNHFESSTASDPKSISSGTDALALLLSKDWVFAFFRYTNLTGSRRWRALESDANRRPQSVDFEDIRMDLMELYHEHCKKICGDDFPKYEIRNSLDLMEAMKKKISGNARWRVKDAGNVGPVIIPKFTESDLSAAIKEAEKRLSRKLTNQEIKKIPRVHPRFFETIREEYDDEEGSSNDPSGNVDPTWSSSSGLDSEEILIAREERDRETAFMNEILDSVLEEIEPGDNYTITLHQAAVAYAELRAINAHYGKLQPIAEAYGLAATDVNLYLANLKRRLAAARQRARQKSER